MNRLSTADSWIMAFGPTLKDIREDEGLTQEELAQKTGLTAMHISHFECGRRLPSLENFRALILALGNYSGCLLDLPDAPRATIRPAIAKAGGTTKYSCNVHDDCTAPDVIGAGHVGMRPSR